MEFCREDGNTLGIFVGYNDGCIEGKNDGTVDGSNVGCDEGMLDGLSVGNNVGQKIPTLKSHGNPKEFLLNLRGSPLESKRN